MLAIGADHRGYKLKEELKKFLDESEIEYIDCGTYSSETVHYPEMAKKVAEKVQENKAEGGILICGSGGGMTIVANKFKGIRCECCNSEDEAKEAKSHNGINIIALPADRMNISQAVDTIRAWLGTEILDGRYLERRKMVQDIEKENMK
ncbi:MAG: ribose 5-phosphate isomerase B [Clostridia bacterium]|nr:ribose 5-phosphate isomerase B [Clostridia bacterium]